MLSIMHIIVIIESHMIKVLSFSSVVFGGFSSSGCSCSSHTSSLKNWSENGFWLFPIVERHITSWPLGILNAVEDIDKSIESMDAIYHFGIYELHIHNGKKSLIIR